MPGGGIRATPITPYGASLLGPRMIIASESANSATGLQVGLKNSNERYGSRHVLRRLKRRMRLHFPRIEVPSHRRSSELCPTSTATGRHPSGIKPDKQEGPFVGRVFCKHPCRTFYPVNRCKIYPALTNCSRITRIPHSRRASVSPICISQQTATTLCRTSKDIQMATKQQIKLGQKLKGARLARGLLMREIADAVGCSKSLISKFENGKASPSLSTLHRIVRTLGTNIGALFDHDSGPRYTLREQTSDH